MKKTLIALLLLLTCLCLTGCGLKEQLVGAVMDVVAQKAEESGTAALARQFVDGILAHDADQVASALTPEIPRESIETALEELAALLPADAAGYTLTPTSWNVQTNNGETRETFQFLLTIGEHTFLLETLRLSGYERLANVHMQEIDPAAVTSGGTSAPAFSAWTIVSLVLTIAVFAVIIWAFVDALRRPLNRRWLWLLVIILGNLLLVFTAANGQVRLNCNLGLHLSAAQIAVGDGGFGLKAMLPVGAVIYLTIRKKLQKPTGQEGFAEAFAPPVQEASPIEDGHEPEEF
ncbi:MAG: hypothetical protein IKK21_01865 [Clostridia bacterium]|nr:hypothetical protein [Clostridia bacterium]